jgi:ABC-type nitrate/sulfonate/bicarbonate transport system substrate-binding protein
MQLLGNGEALVHSSTEIIQVRRGESTEMFLRRLLQEHGVGPHDLVEITYKEGMPQYAAIERGKMGR